MKNTQKVKIENVCQNKAQLPSLCLLKQFRCGFSRWRQRGGGDGALCWNMFDCLLLAGAFLNEK